MSGKFMKNCSQCNCEMFYSRKDALKDSILKNRLCRSCSRLGDKNHNYGKKLSDETKTKICKHWFQKGDRPINADERKNKTYEEIYGKSKSEDIRIKLSSYERTLESNNKRSTTMKYVWSSGQYVRDFRCTDEARRKHRINMINRLQKTNCNFHPPYNNKACKYFDELMVENNIVIKHALNGGELHLKELGYWVDGYDEINNVVYEFDEKYHFDDNGELRQKDINRQTEITNFLNCKFVRIKWDSIHP